MSSPLDPPDIRTLTTAERLAFVIEERAIRQRVLVSNGTLDVEDVLETAKVQLELALQLQKEKH